MKILKSLLIIFALLLSQSALAAPLKILFFYPGGQGSQELAQPLLDAFADSLKKASDSQLEAKIFYIADKEKGLQFIAKEKPAAAIVSQDIAEAIQEKFKARPIAQTLQLPSSDGSDRFVIVGAKGSPLPSSGALSLGSSRPLEAAFLQEKLFPQLKNLQLKSEATPNILGLLRAIGSLGAEPKYHFALLDQFEYANISRLKAAWVSQISVVAESQKIPSAPVLAFSENLKEPEKLAQALEKMGQNNESAEILENLRLKGFKALAPSAP